MADTIPGTLSARFLYLADEYRDHVQLAVGAMPRATVAPRALLGAVRVLLGQIPDGDGPLRLQDSYAVERAIALLMLALKPERSGNFSGERLASENVVHTVPREELVDLPGTHAAPLGDRDRDRE